MYLVKQSTCSWIDFKISPPKKGAGKLGRQTALSVQEIVTKRPRLTMPDGPNISPHRSAERLWTTRGIKSGENHNVKT